MAVLKASRHAGRKRYACKYAIYDSGVMSTRKITIFREISIHYFSPAKPNVGIWISPVEERQEFGRSGCVPPVAHELARNSEEREHLNTCVAHTIVCGCRYERIERPRCLVVCEYRVSSITQ